MSRVFAPNHESYGFNPYYDPEECGLEIVAEVDTSEPYEFEKTVLFKDVATGDLLLAQSSGCSCPTPFEEFDSTGSMIPAVNEDEIRRAVTEFHSGYSKSITSAEIEEFLARWRAAL